MKRRRFLTGAATGIAASAAASALSRPAVAQGNRRLRMVTTWPKDFPGLGTGARRLAETITRMSDGRLSVEVYAAGELVPAGEAFDAVSGGAAELYHGIEYYWQDRSRAFNFFAAVPFGMTGAELAAWVYHGGGQALWDELSARFNIKPFQVGNTGAQMGGWFNKEINTLEDIQGLRIRMPGLGGEVLARLGAKPVALAGTEIFPALQSGKIDATEWTGPWNDLLLGFHKVARYYYYPGFHEPGTALSCGFNLKLWKDLADADRAVIAAAAAAESQVSRAEFDAENAAALDQLKRAEGVDIRRFPNGVLTAVGGASGAVVAGLGDGGDSLTHRIAEAFRAFRKRALSWSHIADQSFQNARLLPFKY